MKNTEKTSKVSKLLNGACVTDVNYKIVGTLQKGEVLNRHNMSVRGKTGEDIASVDTLGDEKIFDYGFTNYECIASFTVRDYLIEFWCYKNGTDQFHPVRITFNGTVMIETDKLVFDTDHHIQFDTNDSCNGGEFYITDFNENTFSPPYIFSLNDITESYFAGSQKYFSDFNPLLYQLALNMVAHHPVFLGLVDVGGGGGLPVGKYNYAIRYADTSGNRTGWSVQTPNIPVPRSGATGQPLQYPALKNYGDDVDKTSETNFGIHIKFRIENKAGYSYIEIRRCKHYDGLAINAFATPEVRKFTVDYLTGSTVDILTNPDGIGHFLDDASVTDWQQLTDEGDTNELSGSFICKSLRYYQNRLVAMNIKKPSMEIPDDIFVNKEDMLGFPVVEKLTGTTNFYGHGDVWLNTYYPHLQSGEKYGWGVYLQDSYGNRTFVKPFDDGVSSLKSYQMPNRRVPLSPQTAFYSVLNWKGASKCANIFSSYNSSYEDSVGYTHEVFDLVNAVAKTDYCGWKNIMTNTPTGVANPHKSIIKLTDHDCDIPDGWNSGGYVNAGDIGYQPYTPTLETHTDVSGLNYVVNDYVYDYYTTLPDFSANTPNHPPTNVDKYAYEPQGFRPNFFSTGMGFWGLKDLPAWAKSFSIVRTKPAGRVVCQGIGFWSLAYDQESSNYGQTDRNDSKFWFYSPDADTNLSGANTSFTDLINNATSYSVQLVSPLGSFSEIYDGKTKDDNPLYPALIPGTLSENPNYKGWSTGVDMITYCKVLYENGSINPSYGIGSVGHGHGYVTYGRWLNSNGAGSLQADVWNSNDGDKVFKVNAIASKSSGRTNFVELTLDQSVYKYGGINHSYKVAYPPQEFGEPFYIVNIILDGKDVPYNDNQTSYIETGHLQKIESKIGVGAGGNAEVTYPLIDERWEDCIVNDLSATKKTDNRYVYVDGNAWINIKYKDSWVITNILTEIQNNGFAVINDTDVDGLSVDVKVYGVYTNDSIPSVDRTFGVKFTWSDQTFDASYFIPALNTDILVKYDNRVPIRVFAGDTYIGEHTCCMHDGQSDKGGNEYEENRWMRVCTGFPYQAYHVNNRHYIVEDTRGTNKIQDHNYIMPKAVRQFMVNSIFESKINIPFIYGYNKVNATDYTNGCFPQVNYVMRPHSWTDHDNEDYTSFLDYNNIRIEYYDDYGFEWNNWSYGGFRGYYRNNIDYMKSLNDRANLSKPLLGYKEITKFCTKIIYSNKRSINEQDDPNLRSFPALNAFTISDAYEEIKYAYDNDSSKGNNLYAITGGGVCLLITDKSILSDKGGDHIAMISPETGFIQGEYWLTKDNGCPDEMWRGIAEFNNDLFVPNRRGVFMMRGNDISDITNNYGRELIPYLEYVKPKYDTEMYGVYNKYFNEYWLGIGGHKVFDNGHEDMKIKKTFVYCNDADKNFWGGYTDYAYEKATYVEKMEGDIKNDVYGSVGGLTYRTGQPTNKIRGNAYTRELYIVTTPQLSQTVEYVDLTVNSNIKPSYIRYYDKPYNAFVGQTDGENIRNYTNNYYAMIPRRNDNGNRLQNDSFVTCIAFNGDGEFSVVNLETSNKVIKW